ncbi:meiotic nuclear division protein 1 homolog isoform X2 [Centruroides sculpturatus]|uniref:meiotic nuclear division protein 1 homolog isoform X2 n=1 Tax=Centruroides sculpturatus TaxID=218467 RepID=UPI000C6C9250|nr:meiotic nuclear division protein 1 homolog isoform X2 [Centruroides sculpturatus]
MSKRKGLSAEEKRQRMLQLFYERKEVFQLKELEKIAPKEKGIVSQSVKDVVQSLVDDGLVDTDKIGTSVYFWSFPSKATNSRKRKLQDLETQIEESKKQLSGLSEQLNKAQVGKEETNERIELLKELESMEKERDKLKSDLKKYQDCDPKMLESMKNQTAVAKEAANRWTDNIYALKSWCKKKFFIEESVINKQFSIPEDIDYLN